jgi:hypothetical protein
MMILAMSHLSIWMVMTMESVRGNEARLMSSAKNMIGQWDHLVLVIGPSMATWFYLLVVDYPSPLIFEVSIGIPDNSEDCAVGGEVFALLW